MKKKVNKNYEPTHKCQDNWVTQFPWVEMLKGNNGELQHVKCYIYSIIRKRDFLLTPKLDDLVKHVGKTKALKNMLQLGVKVGKWYINKQCWHLQNEPIFACKNQITVLE
jgi:hypothetical protein